MSAPDDDFPIREVDPTKFASSIALHKRVDEQIARNLLGFSLGPGHISRQVVDAAIRNFSREQWAGYSALFGMPITKPRYALYGSKPTSKYYQRRAAYWNRKRVRAQKGTP